MVNKHEAPKGYYAKKADMTAEPVAEEYICEECAFFNKGECSVPSEHEFLCTAEARKDDTDVVFKPITQIAGVASKKTIGREDIIVYFDTETTDLTDNADVIEYAAAVEIDGKITKIYSGLCSTKKGIALEATEIHGIREEDVKGKRRFEKTSFVKYLLNANKNGIKPIIVAHNAGFDTKFLKRLGIKYVEFDTLAIPTIAKMKNKRLQFLRYKYLTKEDEKKVLRKMKTKGNAHSALADVAIMYALCKKKSIKITAEKAEKLRRLLLTTRLTIMTVGKYKGKSLSWIEENDYNYFEWAMNNMSWLVEKGKRSRLESSTMSNKEILYIRKLAERIGR